MKDNTDSFQLRLKDGEIKFTKERFRPRLPFFYVDVMRCSDFYDMEEIFQSETIDLGDFNNENAPTVELYYPYHDPVFIRLQWWNDTYSGIVAVRAVENPGWVELKASWDDIEFETYKGPDEEYARHRKRQRYLQLNDVDVEAIRRAHEYLKNGKTIKSDDEIKDLSHVCSAIAAQRIW